MIGNIKLQQIVARQTTRQTKGSPTIAEYKQDQSSSESNLVSDLAGAIKAKLETISDDVGLEKIMHIKALMQQGLYEVDIDQLATKILEHYRMD